MASVCQQQPVASLVAGNKSGLGDTLKRFALFVGISSYPFVVSTFVDFNPSRMLVLLMDGTSSIFFLAITFNDGRIIKRRKKVGVKAHVFAYNGVITDVRSDTDL